MTDKPIELKPCPFCGANSICAPFEGVSEYCECEACNAYGPSGDTSGELWNLRTPDRATLVEVARRATLEAMRPIYGPSFVVEPDWCERIVSEYLAEQAGKDAG